MIPELFELLRDAINWRSEQINTCFMGRIVSYDPGSQRADITPVVKRPVRTDTEGRSAEPLPDLLDVPVMMPHAGDRVFHFPLSEGDYVLVMVPQWNHSQWYDTGDKQVDPGDVAHHSLGSTLALPIGSKPSTELIQNLNAEDILLGSSRTDGTDRASVRVTPATVVLGQNGAASKRVARKDDPVRVTLTVEAVGAILTGPSPGSPCTAAGPITLTGTITEGTPSVLATD